MSADVYFCKNTQIIRSFSMFLNWCIACKAFTVTYIILFKHDLIKAFKYSTSPHQNFKISMELSDHNLK